MIEKIGHVKNPLTVIAMFAAITEVSGTLVLPFIDSLHQATYIWFLMLFPFVLVLIFFATLNFNHKALYAPSDWKDETNFFRKFGLATEAETKHKLDNEIAAVEAALKNLPPEDIPSTQPPEDIPSTQPPEDIPSTQPPEDIPSTQPPEDIPSTQPPEDILSTQPPEDIPSAQSPEDIPSTQPPEDIPSTQPPEDIPSTQPPEDIPNTQLPEVTSSHSPPEAIAPPERQRNLTEQQKAEAKAEFVKSYKISKSYIDLHKYNAIENSAIIKLNSELNVPFQRNVSFRQKSGKRVIFDALALEEHRVTAAEVVFIPGGLPRKQNFDSLVRDVENVANVVKESGRDFVFYYIAVFQNKNINKEFMQGMLWYHLKDYDLNIRLRIFTMEDIEGVPAFESISLN